MPLFFRRSIIITYIEDSSYSTDTITIIEYHYGTAMLYQPHKTQFQNNNIGQTLHYKEYPDIYKIRLFLNHQQTLLIKKACDNENMRTDFHREIGFEALSKEFIGCRPRKSIGR